MYSDQQNQTQQAKKGSTSVVLNTSDYLSMQEIPQRLIPVIQQGLNFFTRGEAFALSRNSRSLFRKINACWRAAFGESRQEFAQALQRISTNPTWKAIKILLLKGLINAKEANNLCDLMPTIGKFGHYDELEKTNRFALAMVIAKCELEEDKDIGLQTLLERHLSNEVTNCIDGIPISSETLLSLEPNKLRIVLIRPYEVKHLIEVTHITMKQLLSMESGKLQVLLAHLSHCYPYSLTEKLNLLYKEGISLEILLLLDPEKLNLLLGNSKTIKCLINDGIPLDKALSLEPEKLQVLSQHSSWFDVCFEKLIHEVHISLDELLSLKPEKLNLLFSNLDAVMLLIKESMSLDKALSLEPEKLQVLSRNLSQLYRCIHYAHIPLDKLLSLELGLLNVLLKNVYAITLSVNERKIPAEKLLALGLEKLTKLIEILKRDPQADVAHLFNNAVDGHEQMIHDPLLNPLPESEAPMRVPSPAVISLVAIGSFAQKPGEQSERGMASTQATEEASAPNRESQNQQKSQKPSCCLM